MPLEKTALWFEFIVEVLLDGCSGSEGLVVVLECGYLFYPFKLKPLMQFYVVAMTLHQQGYIRRL